MAILGVQIVLSMIMASILSKFSSHFSFGRWILCSRLARYMHPTDEELRKLVGVTGQANKGKGNKKAEQAKRSKDEPFTLPKTADIQLESVPIKTIDLLPLQFYLEYQWLIDVAICGLTIYTITEVYYAVVQPLNELNLSILWCFVIVAFCLKTMFSLTAMYFRTEEGGEKVLCLLFGFFFLVIAMAVLIVDEDTLEFGLEPAYANFSSSAKEFLERQGFESAGPVSLLTVRIVLALICAILGAFLTFPGLRLAKMYTDALRYAKGRPVIQLFLHFNLILPLLISLMWIRPLFREYLVNRKYKGQSAPLLTGEMFEFVRLACLFVFCIFRFLLIWQHLQAHLNMAVDKVAELKKEAGRISSVDLKKMVVRVYYYLCVVALQYLSPLIMLFFLSLMLKTLGNFSIVQTFNLTPIANLSSDAVLSVNSGESEVNPIVSAGESSEALNDISENIWDTASHFSIMLVKMRAVFTPLCFRGLLSFFCWWICVAWFTTSAFGVFHYTYFNV